MGVKVEVSLSVKITCAKLSFLAVQGSVKRVSINNNPNLFSSFMYDLTFEL